MSLISIVVPCYNEQDVLQLFYDDLTNVMTEMKAAHQLCFEIIFVDDGSGDDTLLWLRNHSLSDKQVQYISFSRNFGKEAAMLAGLEAAMGDYVVIMDADLQDPPQLLPEMYTAISEDGVDCVATRRTTRSGEPVIRSFFAKMFFKLINSISKTKIIDGARDFRMMSRPFANAVLNIKEYNRFSKGIFGWVGFNTKWIDFNNAPRAAGNTKWSFWKLFLYSIDAIVTFSTVPLSISAAFGILFCMVSLLSAVFIVVRYILFGDPVTGWASTICVLLFTGGIQLFCMGMLGQYIAKAYLEIKKRPHYIVKEKSESQIVTK